MLATKGGSKCPFRGLKKCDKECILFRSGIKYTDDLMQKAEPFEDCAFNIMTDNIEVMHHRIYATQAETGQMKNVLAMKLMHDMGMRSEKDVKHVLARTIEIGTEEERKKLLEDKE